MKIEEVEQLCKKAREASYKLAVAGTDLKNRAIFALADAIVKQEQSILEANAIDLKECKKQGAFFDRLKLTHERIEAMAQGMREVAQLPDPVGEVVESYTARSGIEISKVRTPLGVIGVIYEARPNVTADVAALCLKSGNAVVLRGGSDAVNSNRAIFSAMHKALCEFDMQDAIALLDDKERESTKFLLQQEKYVDAIIPRGGDQLKKFVLEHATMPVIASAGGNCHVYVEKTADLDMATEIILNAKLSRPSACNAMEQILIDESIAPKAVGLLLKALTDAGVSVKGCEKTQKYFACENADDEYFYIEHLALEAGVKIVNGTEEAVDWINEHGTKHSEAIVTSDESAAQCFLKGVDAAAVYVNASTRFTDGFEFGFGAEIGISTQKLHARGPLGLRELTSCKYECKGKGQIR